MDTSNKILLILKEKNQVTANELADSLKISKPATLKHLNRLLEKGQVVKSGKHPKIVYSLALNAQKVNNPPKVSIPKEAPISPKEVQDPKLILASKGQGQRRVDFWLLVLGLIIIVGWVFWPKRLTREANKSVEASTQESSISFPAPISESMPATQSHAVDAAVLQGQESLIVEIKNLKDQLANQQAEIHNQAKQMTKAQAQQLSSNTQIQIQSKAIEAKDKLIEQLQHQLSAAQNQVKKLMPLQEKMDQLTRDNQELKENINVLKGQLAKPQMVQARSAIDTQVHIEAKQGQANENLALHDKMSVLMKDNQELKEIIKSLENQMAHLTHPRSSPAGTSDHPLSVKFDENGEMVK